MNGLWLLLLILICPVTMGALMLFMMRGMRGEHRGRMANGRGTARPPGSTDEG